MFRLCLNVMYSQCIQILLALSVIMTECKVTGWRLTDELVLMKHWKANDGCLFVSFWLDLITNASTPGRRDIGSWCWQYYKWHHPGLCTLVLTTRVTNYRGWTCKYTRRIYLSAHHLRGMELRLIMMKFHKCYKLHQHEWKIFLFCAQSVFPCNFDVKMRLTANLSLLRNEISVNFSDCCPWHLTWTE